jgi:hypothetical protein
MQRDGFGMLPVVIDHPLGTLSDAKSDRRAEPAIPHVCRSGLGHDGAIAIDAMPYSVY